MGRRGFKLDNWQEDYQRKLVSPEEAAQAIKSGENIFIPSAYSGYMPYAIVARRDELKGVTVEVSSPLFDPGWLSPGMEESFEVIVRTYLATARQAHDEGRISFLPYTNGSYFKVYRDNRPVKRDIDVFLMEVSPPDENGFLTFGPYAWQKRNYTEKARTIIAEIDEHMIRSRGDTSIHISEVDYLVDITAPPLTDDEIEQVINRFPPEKLDRVRQSIAFANPRTIRNLIDVIDGFQREYIEFMFHLNDPSEEVKAIAENLKTVVRDRDTIQIGVGAVSGHMIELGVFDDLKDIGIWTEVSAPGMGFLVKRGIATGKYATLHPGKAVFATLSGMRGEEIRWAHENPLIELHRADYVVNVTNISRIENMIAINNVTQVDLTGQITCETQFGPRMINGPGGQPEFHIGAFLAPGGRAVSLMLSTWSDGAVSTIVPYLEQGSIVTIPRVFADIIITEYGVADLVGKTHRERTQELIRIAHPDHRAELQQAAKEIC
jgi:4-hydroxybutyrate CoA-transferase